MEDESKNEVFTSTDRDINQPSDSGSTPDTTPNSEYKENKRDKRNWIIAALVVALLYNQFVIYNRLSEIEWNTRSANANIGSIFSELSSLQWRLMDTIESQTRLIDSESIEYSVLDTTDFTTDVTVSITLKEYNDNTAVSISNGVTEIPMEKSGAQFTGVLKVSVFETFHPKITIEDNGTFKTESLESYTNLHDEYLLNVSASSMGGWTYTNGNDYFDVDTELEVTVIETPYSQIKDISFIAVMDGEIILEIPLENTEFQSKPFKEKLPYSENKPINGYIKVIDNNDLEYYYFVDYFFMGEMTSDEQHEFSRKYFSMVITDSDGNVLYEPEYY